MTNSPDQPVTFDDAIASNALPERNLEANRIASEIKRLLSQMAAISSDGSVINYSFWKSRNAAESTDAMIRARQAMYDAREMKRKSIFEDEYVFDFKTKEKQITRLGAEKLFEEAFTKWDEVLQDHRDLIDSPVMNDLVRGMREYFQLLMVSGKPFPDDFVLQWVIDLRAKRGESDQLPTSDAVQALLEDAEDAAEGDDEEEETDAKELTDAEATDAEETDAEATNDDAESDDAKETDAEEADGEAEAGESEDPESEDE